jgi:hypothetical protein
LALTETTLTVLTSAAFLAAPAAFVFKSASVATLFVHVSNLL